MLRQSTSVYQILLIGLIALLSTTGPARAQVGVAAGLDFEALNDIETTTNVSENATVENAVGYHLGVVYDLGLGPVNLRPGLLYRKIGTYEFPESKSDVSSWEVPVDVRVTLVPTPLVSIYALGGPKAVFPRAEGDLDSALEDVSYVFNIGAGVDLSVPGAGITLQPELRYEFGATNYVDDEFEIGDTTFKPSDQKLSAFALRLNVIL